MIVDRLSNYSRYISINKGFKSAFEFIQNYYKDEFVEGRYDIDGNDVYAFVQLYNTMDTEKKLWEAHKRYIDIHYIVTGREIIRWTNIDNVVINTEYDKEKDFSLFNGDEGNSVQMEKESFCVLFTEDAHKPGCLWNESCNIKKIVIKIKI